MTKRLAVVAGAAVLGAVGLTAPAAAAARPAAVTPAITCLTHSQEVGSTRYSYFGNCKDNAVSIHVWEIYIPPGSDLPVNIDKGDHCVAAQTDYLMGTMPTDFFGGYTGTETGAC